MKRRSSGHLARLWGELTAASAETIARRFGLIVTGRCTPAEYRRMVREKLAALGQMSRAALKPRATEASLLAPWHRAARRNAKRLRRR